MQEAKSIGSGIINQKLYCHPEGEKFKFVAIFSKNRPEWTLVDVGCLFYGITTIPIYDTLGDENISFVFNHTKVTTVFVNDVSVKALMKTKDLGDIQNIVSFDSYTSEQEEYFKDKGIVMIKYSDVIKSGE